MFKVTVTSPARIDFGSFGLQPASTRVSERGTHAGLLASGGLYARLWDLQNRMLRED